MGANFHFLRYSNRQDKTWNTMGRITAIVGNPRLQAHITLLLPAMSCRAVTNFEPVLPTVKLPRPSSLRRQGCPRKRPALPLQQQVVRERLKCPAILAAVNGHRLFKQPPVASPPASLVVQHCVQPDLPTSSEIESVPHCLQRLAFDT